MAPKAQPMIALYLGATKKKPIFALKLIQNPKIPPAGFPWGQPVEVTVDKNDETAPGPLMQMLYEDPIMLPDGYEPEPLSEEVEQALSMRRRIGVTAEPFGKILLYPTSHNAGGGGYGNMREGLYGVRRLSDFELIQLARSL